VTTAQNLGASRTGQADSFVELDDPDAPPREDDSASVIVFDSVSDLPGETIGDGPRHCSLECAAGTSGIAIDSAELDSSPGAPSLPEKTEDDSLGNIVFESSDSVVLPQEEKDLTEGQTAGSSTGSVAATDDNIVFDSIAAPPSRTDRTAKESSASQGSVVSQSHQQSHTARMRTLGSEKFDPAATLDSAVAQSRGKSATEGMTDASAAPSGDPSTGQETTVMQGKERKGMTSPGNTEMRGLANFGYEILGELGRGGMGVVYKARQNRLNRIVALKMILAGGMAKDKDIARFRIEAEAVAQFQHPNIVQIYEIGESGDCPYFSLEYVEGGSLSQKVAKEPLSAREAAQMTRTIAGAMDYAHKHEIIHRDLKPANILLTADGQPKVTDFGLAKKFSEDTGQTRTGAVLGTPSFMAPEQAQGKTKEVGPPADIYSLGAILYDLLTGRPPFRGETVIETLLRVKNDPPMAPRRLQPSIPRDLETICLKCLEKEPAKRYRTAGDMAEDLRRFLEGEPIRARAATPPELAMKWVKRHPLQAAVYALVSILFFGGFATSLVVAKQKSELADKSTEIAAAAKRETDLERSNVTLQEQKTRDAQAATKRVQENFDRANKNLKIAQSAVQILVEKVVGLRLAREPGLELLKRDLLEQALRVYDELLHDAGADEGTRWQTGLAYLRTGDIKELLNEHAQAEAAYDQAVTFFKELNKQFPDKKEFLEDLGTTEINLANVYRDTGRDQKAADKYAESKVLWEKLTAGDAKNANYREKLEQTLNNYGLVLRRLGKRDDAETALRAAIKEQQALVASFPAKAEYRGELGESLINLAELVLAKGDAKEALQSLDKAATLYQQLATEQPKTAAFLQGLAISKFSRAKLLRDINPSEASTALNDAIAVRKKLADAYPTTPLYRQELAKEYNEWGVMQQAQGNYNEADRYYRDAISIKRDLAQKFNWVPDYGFDLAAGYNTRATFLLTQKRPDEAEEVFNDSVRLLTKLIKENPTRVDFVPELAKVYSSMAGLYQTMKRPQDAGKTYQLALGILEPLAKKSPNIPDYQLELARTYQSMATLSITARDYGEAAKKYDQARGILLQLVGQFPKRQDFRYTLAIVFNNLASLYARLPDRAREREDALGEGIKILTQLTDDALGNPEYRERLAILQGDLGQEQARTSRLDKAEESFRRSIALLEELETKFPDQVGYKRTLATEYFNLSEALRVGGGRSVEREKCQKRLGDLLKTLIVAFPKNGSYQTMLGRMRFEEARQALEDEKPTESRRLLQESITHQRAALATDPKNPQFIQNLGIAYLALLDNLIQLEDRPLVAKSIVEMNKALGPTWPEYYRVAGYLCRCAALAKKDTSIPALRRDDLVDSYCDEAMKMIHQAVDSGYKDVDYLNKSPEIAPLRTRGDFQKLVADLERRVKANRR
jgi:serine/threonine-protein kinase